MEDIKDDVGVEIVTSDDWGIDFQESTPSRIWSDPFEEAAPAEEVQNEEQEPLLEKDLTEGEAEAPKEEEEPEIPENDNPLFFVAKQAVEDGLLPKDLDIPADVDLKFIYSNYKESIQPAVENEILREVDKKLAEAGINEDNIILLQAMQNGTSTEDLYEITKFKKYSTLDENSDDNSKIKVVEEWYKQRGLSDKEIRRNLDAIELNEEVDSEFSEAKAHFSNIISSFEEEQMNIANQRRVQEQQMQQRNATILQNLTKDYVIAGEKLDREDATLIANSIYKKEPVNVNGQHYELSPYEQFYYALNNDFEFSLKVFKDFVLGDKKTANIKTQLKVEAENDWLEAYKKAQEKSTSTSSIKRRSTSSTNAPQDKTTNTGGLYMEI